MTHTNVGVAHTAGRIVGAAAATVFLVLTLPIVLIIAVSGAIVLTIVAIGKVIVTAWRKGRPAPPSPPTPIVKNPEEPVPPAPDLGVVQNPEWGDVDWKKIAICDPSKAGNA